MFEIMDTQTQQAVIKVIGVGGAGGNAVDHMVEQALEGVEFIQTNTDAQQLKHSKVKTQLQIGAGITRGLGAGANPDVGRQAAMEDRDRIEDVLKGADMVFITAGMGGGTGTGAAPVVAEVARELGILTVAVVTKPFVFEGTRVKIAEQGIGALEEYVDSLITIPNEKLSAVFGRDMPVVEAFKASNSVLQNAVQGISELITRPGYINVDFADVKTVMSGMGVAMMGTGAATGEERARRAAEGAINSPLLEDVNLAGARGVLVNVTGGNDMTIGEFMEVGDTVREFADEEATVVIGMVTDESIKDELRVTVVATGLNKGQMEAAVPHLVETEQTPESGAPAQVPAQPDYGDLDKPTVIRNSRRERPASAPSGAATAADIEYLDIPAFLRPQQN